LADLRTVKLLARIVLSTIAVLVADLLLRGVHAPDLKTGLLVAVVLGLLNAFVRPALILLTLPVTVVSLGLFVLVINAGMVLLAARIVPGFEVQGFWWALAFSLVMWLVQSLLQALDGGEKEERS
jgi:putative membrane protein